jgi:hypothetical protein
VATLRIAKFPTSTVTWSNGQNFNGWALVGLVMPTSGTDWSFVARGDMAPGQKLPVFAMVPIVDGLFNTSLGLYFNADIDPPNSQYVYWFYDSTRRQVAGPSSLFTVTADPLTLPALTLTVPSAGATLPVPD